MIILSVLIFLLSPYFVFSQEVFKFFEFAPRSQENIILGDKILVQPFIPFNDYLSIIGFWLDNPKLTKINVKIYSPNNQIIFDKNFNIPLIEGSWWGEEYLLPLDENLRVNSGQEYKISITPIEHSQLKFFAKNILELLQGSETYLYFPESLRPFIINNETTNFTLKLSLYEGKESSPPIISNFQVTINTPRSVTISFNANEPIIYIFEYSFDSTTSTYQIEYFQNCPSGIRNCLINLNVLPGKSYRFVLKALDFWQNSSSLEGVFQTPQEEEKIVNETYLITTSSYQDFSNQIFRQQTSSPTSKELQKVSQVPTSSIKNLDKKKSNKEKTSADKNIDQNQLKTNLKKDETTFTTPTPILVPILTTSSNSFSKKVEIQKKGGINISKIIFFFGIVFLGLLISILLFAKKFRNIPPFFKQKKAFTLLEIAIALSLIILIIVSLFLLTFNIANVNATFVFNLAGESDVILFFKQIEKELRSMQNSNIGNYPIELASSTQIIFYSDIDNDGLVERINYFVENNELKKSVIIPSGNPLQYNSSTEKVSTLVKNLYVPQQVFSFYDFNFQTTTEVSKIKIIKVNLKIYQNLGKNIFENYIIISPRNLRFQE